MAKKSKLLLELEALPSFLPIKEKIIQELLVDDGNSYLSMDMPIDRDDLTQEQKEDIARDEFFNSPLCEGERYDLVHEALYHDMVNFIMDIAKEIVK